MSDGIIPQVDQHVKGELSSTLENLLEFTLNLCLERGYAWAGNAYFADRTGCTQRTISTRLKILEDEGYIVVYYVYGERHIRPGKPYPFYRISTQTATEPHHTKDIKDKKTKGKDSVCLKQDKLSHHPETDALVQNSAENYTNETPVAEECNKANAAPIEDGVSTPSTRGRRDRESIPDSEAQTAVREDSPAPTQAGCLQTQVVRNGVYFPEGKESYPTATIADCTTSGHSVPSATHPTELPHQSTANQPDFLSLEVPTVLNSSGKASACQGSNPRSHVSPKALVGGDCVSEIIMSQIIPNNPPECHTRGANTAGVTTIGEGGDYVYRGRMGEDQRNPAEEARGHTETHGSLQQANSARSAERTIGRASTPKTATGDDTNAKIATLTANGVSPQQARRIAQSHSLLEIQRAVTYMRQQEALGKRVQNPAGWLYSALVKGWSMKLRDTPPERLAAQMEARREKYRVVASVTQERPQESAETIGSRLAALRCLQTPMQGIGGIGV